MKRRRFLSLTGYGAMGMIMSELALSRDSVHSPRPNIILMLADDMGYKDLTCFGGINPTPHLDALAKGGVKLTRFYAASAVCTPTRASIMTGRYPLRFDIRKHFSDGPEHLPQGTVTLQGLLSQAGYNTCHVGKWHLGGLHVDEDGRRLQNMPGPKEHGFHHYQCQIEQQPLRGEMGRNKTLYRKGGHCLIRDDVAVGKDDPYYESHFTDINGDHAVELIRSFAEEDKPFFLNLWWLVPHMPYEPAPEPHWSESTEKGISEDQHRFRSMVRHMDAKVGKIVVTLQELDLLDNTLILFTSDNGGAYEANIGRLKGGKTDLHDGGLRAPFLAHWPKRISPGTTNATLCSTIDLMPTICEAAGVSFSPDLPVDGTSLLDLLVKSSPLPSRDLFWQLDLYKHLQRHYAKPKPYATEVMISEPWKLLTLKGNPVELFHIVEDPLEETNVLEEHRDRAEAMAAKVRAWLEEPRQGWETP